MVLVRGAQASVDPGRGRGSQDPTLNLPEITLLVLTKLALERLEFLPKPPPYSVKVGSSGNPQIQKLRNLDLLFTSSRLAWPSFSGPQSPHHGVDVVPQPTSLLESRRKLSHAG